MPSWLISPAEYSYSSVGSPNIKETIKTTSRTLISLSKFTSPIRMEGLIANMKLSPPNTDSCSVSSIK